MPVVFKKTAGSEAPKDAVLLSREEAGDMVFESITKLGLSKSWPLKGALASLVIGTGMTSIMITNKMRTFFKVGKYGFFTAAIPAAYLPMVGTYVYYRHVIVNPIILKETVCPVCLEVKAMTTQFIAGIFYPFVSCYVITYVTASNLGTISAPPLKLMRNETARKEIFDIFQKFTKRISNTLVTMTVGQCMLATGAIMLQLYSIDSLLEKVEQKRIDDINEIRNEREKKLLKQGKLSNISLNA